MEYELLIFLIPWLLPVIWSVIGYMTEKKHLQSLDEREAAARDIVVTNLKTVANPESVQRAQLVAGNVVIGTDYFKTLVTNLRNLVGGEMKAAQRLLTRARREALLRLLDEAREMGATEVWNLRYQFCNIQQMSGNKGAMSVEIYAYGTAITRKT
ncbi:MAG: heavy metal-binding domain-containing protein [Phycisphaerales bacterium]|nr:heavy metal-binding domain-containing protein [Phycisphaerales bacterium]MCB9857977.1 heavy metal-binding domain-containing protein [Phycisphaerales bacterium]MCB9864930.1 heavy metal-binding domain-containing protein [Phycisphaerales bacterium]